MIFRGRGKVDLGLDQVQQFLPLFIGLSIPTVCALTEIGAEQTGAQTVAVELEAAGSAAVARFVRSCIMR